MELRGSSSDFDNVLESCVSGLRDGWLTLDQCLQLYPDQAAHLMPLLKIVCMIIPLREVNLRAGARYEMKMRLKARASAINVASAQRALDAQSDQGVGK